MNTLVAPGGEHHTHVFNPADYEIVRENVLSFNGNATKLQGPFFIADVDALNFDLNTEWLNALPVENRQYHTCSACRAFLHRYGALVTVDENGATRSVLWQEEEAPTYYRPAVDALRRAVERSPIKCVAVFDDVVLGTPEAGGFTHFAIQHPALRNTDRTETAGQVRARRREDFKNINRALVDFSRELVERVLALIDTGQLPRGSSLRPSVQWLLDRYTDRNIRVPSVRNNRLWAAVAIAPKGWCAPRGSLVGSLLKDLKDGVPLATALHKFNANADSLAYMRPTAAPREGQIAVAEKLVKQLGIAPALRRRMARRDEIRTFWEPPVAAAKQGGVFDHLKSTDRSAPEQLNTTPSNITWEKFARTILPHATRIEVKLPFRSNIVGFTTATDPDAPPIVQWDAEGSRNPISTYVYHGGSSPDQWGLKSNQWITVTGITQLPQHWQPGFERQTAGVVLLLQGARESNTQGLRLFPEILKGELHGVRSVIEAHSNRTQLDVEMGAHAVGALIAANGAALVRVVTPHLVQLWNIDRLD